MRVELFERLLREGIIVRPLAGFGSPTAIRISVGTPEELDVLREALGRVLRARSALTIAILWQRVPSPLRRQLALLRRSGPFVCSS